MGKEELGMASKIKYIQTTTKMYITTTKYPFSYSFATVVVSGEAEISDDNKMSNISICTIHQPGDTKRSPWRARVVRAPKAQAVAMGDLLGNLLKIHGVLWYGYEP